jgi:precorrin-3B methylase
MAQTISNHETQLTTYLTNQVSDTLHKIRMIEKSIKVLTDGDTSFTNTLDEVISESFTQAFDNVIQSKYEEIIVLKFRLAWLQSQLTQVKSLNQ